MIDFNNYDEFYYQNYNYDFDDKFLNITFEFKIKNLDTFITKHKIPFKNKVIKSYELDKLIFYLGLIESLSVYKLTVAKKIFIKCGFLDDDEIYFFKKIIKYGLSEFFYLNKINFNDLKLEIYSYHNYKSFFNQNYDLKGYLIPVGGGKDSVVSIELLKKSKDITLFSLNSLKSSKKCIDIASVKAIISTRELDDKIIKYNKLGFYNGHTPFSAMLSFVCAIVAFLNGIKTIVLSNENSANESTIIGDNINHQYSKSLEYENDFRALLKKHLKGLNLEYLSFLRPLSELQISKIFANLKNYHLFFKSCNLGSKQGIWCNNCGKCLFIYIMLSAFLETDEMIKIFGVNLYEKIELLDIFKQLIGLSKHKPFECVGTIDEINIALNMAMKKHKHIGLLKYYQETESYLKYKNTTYDFKSINNQHNLNDDLLKLLLEKI